MSNYIEEYIPINGIEHFLLHYPKAPDAPVLLFLHGGPGNFESLFAYMMDSDWGDIFTQVHWDQRGAGKTLRRNKKNGWPQSVEQMLDDLHGVVGYLKEKYRVDQVVLLGHSWGSLLGSLYALQHPENVSAYIGVGQVVNLSENERVGFGQVKSKAKAAGNSKHIAALERMGDYPPSDPEQLMKLLPKMRKIQEAYDDGPVSGSGLGDMLKLMRRSPSFRWSDLLSFLQMMQVNHPLHLRMMAFDLGELPPRYQMPVHYILGEADTITPVALAKAYFDRIESPSKTIALIPGAGHMPMLERRAEFAAALRTVREIL